MTLDELNMPKETTKSWQNTSTCDRIPDMTMKNKRDQRKKKKIEAYSKHVKNTQEKL